MRKCEGNVKDRVIPSQLLYASSCNRDTDSQRPPSRPGGSRLLTLKRVPFDTPRGWDYHNFTQLCLTCNQLECRQFDLVHVCSCVPVRPLCVAYAWAHRRIFGALFFYLWLNFFYCSLSLLRSMIGLVISILLVFTV